MTQKAKMYAGIKLKDSHWNEAENRVQKAPIFKRSHRKREANIVGFLGEVVAEAWFMSNNIEYEDLRSSTEMDYVIASTYSLDVKTKDRTVKPKADYDNSVPLYNHEHQRPDFYLFISLLRKKNFDQTDIRRFTYAYIVGAINIEGLERQGKVWRKGEVDVRNGTKFWTDCINVEMSQLIAKDYLLELWKSNIS